MNITRLIVIIPIAALLLNGCASTEGYKKPISDFQNASSVVIQSAGVYITQLNKTQRDAYIDRQVTSGKQISLPEIKKLQVSSPKAIAARLDALDNLSRYGALLGQLASSDAPARISINAKGLSDSLDKLAGNVSKLTGSEDAKFKGAFGPAALLIGEVARFAVERKRAEALDHAILTGGKPVNDLINVIENDLDWAYLLKAGEISDNRVIHIAGYHMELKKKAPLDVLRKRGQEIKSALDLWENLSEGDPSNGLKEMREAHNALIVYAASSKRPRDLETLAAQMEIFAERAKRVGDAVQKLQQLNND